MNPPDTNGKSIAIFDLDGTIAIAKHRLHHIQGNDNDWDAFYEACDQDVPRKDVISLMHIIKDAGYKILLATGRSEVVEEKTRKWLSTHNVPYDQLTMRPEGDFRQSDQLKEYWLDLIKPERVIFAVDDRLKDARMYRNHGVTCFHVTEDDF